MTTVRTRRLAAASIALAAATGLAACGTGFDAATNQQYQPAIGANVREGDVQLYNAMLVTNPDGTYSLSVGLVNTTDQEQTVTAADFTPMAEDATEITDAEPAAEVVVPTSGLRTVGAAGEFAGLEIEGIQEGLYVTITLTFDGAGDVTVNAPVVARTADYREIAAAPPTSPDEVATEEAAAEADAEESAQ